MATKIEWTDETWNPVTGCTQVSPGCKNCYAERMAKRLAGRNGYPADEPFKVTIHKDKLRSPPVPRTDRGKKRRVFVCSMSDIAHRDVPDIIIDHCTRYMALCHRRHDWLVLTKRPQRLSALWKDKDPLPNLWLGVTAEDQERWDERTRELCRTKAAVRFVSVEPMLEPIDARFGPNPTCIWCDGRGEWYADGGAEMLPVTCECMTRNRLINQVIVGCESGPNRRPMDPEWALDLVRQCKDAGVACFVKQVNLNGRVSKDPDEWPEELRVREFPEG